jgi:opacity protein-like surface antigen
MGFSLTRVLAITVLLAGSAAAQTDYPEDRRTSSEGGGAGYRDEGTFSLKPGLGFTASPDTFLLGFEGDYRVAEPFSLGLLTEVGIDSDLTIVSPQLFARYWPDLGELIDPDVSFIEPYLHLGIGFTWWDADVYKGVNDDDTQFLLSPGFGVDFRINEHVAIGTQMLFNVIPGSIHDDTRIDDDFYYSWEVIGVRFRF